MLQNNCVMEIFTAPTGQKWTFRYYSSTGFCTTTKVTGIQNLTVSSLLIQHECFLKASRFLSINKENTSACGLCIWHSWNVQNVCFYNTIWHLTCRLLHIPLRRFKLITLSITTPYASYHTNSIILSYFYSSFFVLSTIQHVRIVSFVTYPN